jgi:hypothetical protein
MPEQSRGLEPRTVAMHLQQTDGCVCLMAVGKCLTARAWVGALRKCGVQNRPVMHGPTNFKSQSPQFQHGVSQPFQELSGYKFDSAFATATPVDSKC